MPRYIALVSGSTASELITNALLQTVAQGVFPGETKDTLRFNPDFAIRRQQAAPARLVAEIEVFPIYYAHTQAYSLAPLEELTCHATR